MMQVKLVFDDWLLCGFQKSIYNTELGVSLSSGDLHSGTTFGAKVSLDPEIEDEIAAAWRDHGAYPVFMLIPEE